MKERLERETSVFTAVLFFGIIGICGAVECGLPVMQGIARFIQLIAVSALLAGIIGAIDKITQREGES